MMSDLVGRGRITAGPTVQDSLRGQTQVLTVATLGTISDSQLLDGIDNEKANYMHHYNMPSYSVEKLSRREVPDARDRARGACRKGIATRNPQRG